MKKSIVLKLIVLTLVLLFLGLVMSFEFGGPFTDGIVIHFFNETQPPGEFAEVGAINSFGQGFYIGADGQEEGLQRDAFLVGIGLFLKMSDPSENITVALNVSVWKSEASDNSIMTELIATNFTTNITGLSAEVWEWVNISFADFPGAILRNRSNYTFMVHNRNFTVDTNGLQIAEETGGVAYEGGTEVGCDADWFCSETPAEDIYFYLFTNTTIPPPGFFVILETPPENAGRETGNETFGCSADNSANDVDINNVTFNLWLSNTTIFNTTFLDLTAASSNIANETFNITGMFNDSYSWNCVVDAASTIERQANNRTLHIDSVEPTITAQILSIYASTPLDLNYSFIDTSPNTCWFSLDDRATNTTVTCGNNASVTPDFGDNTVFVYVNDSIGNEAHDTSNFTLIAIRDLINDTLVTETATPQYLIEILNGSSTLISAIFTHNNTEHDFTSTFSNETSVFINSSFQIPLINPVNYTINWTWNLSFGRDDDFVNLTAFGSQFIERMDFQACNVTYPDPFVNFTFQDENTETRIAGHFNPAKFTYSLTPDLILNRTLTFTDLIDRDSFGFCFKPPKDNVTVAMDIDYLNETVQQRNLIQTVSFTNNTENITLFLLGSDVGRLVTFTVLSLADQPIQGVSVTAEREVGGTFQIVEVGTTDDSGSVTFFLNRNKVHRIIYVKEGFDTLVTTIVPSVSFFTVTLGAIVVTNETNYFRGILRETFPKQDVLANNTNYTFIFNITSSFFNLEESGFTLANLSGTQLGTATCFIGTGCASSLNISTFNETTIIMNYFWRIDGNNTNLTRRWRVVDDLGFVSSWDKFKSDFAKLGASFGGGQNADFTRAIIAFFIIFALTASVSFFAGVNSPLAIVGMITVGVGFFELLGWMPTLNESFPMLLTIIMGAIFGSLAIQEFRK